MMPDIGLIDGKMIMNVKVKKKKLNAE